MNLYMTIEPLTLTNLDTLDTIEYNDLEGLLNEALKKSNTVYCYDLKHLSVPIVNKLYGLGYTEKPVYEMDTINSKIDSMEFMQLTSKEGNTYVIRARRSARIQTKFINAANLFGGLSKDGILESNGYYNEDMYSEIYGMITAIEKLIAEGHDAITLSSNAFNDMRNTCMVDKNGTYRHTIYMDNFPTLTTEEHNFVISSFQNGICAFNEDYKGITEVNGTSYDVNSMYPSVMMEEALPVGKPKYFTGQFKRGLGYTAYFQRVKIKKLELKEDGIECLRNREEQCYYREAEDLEVVLNHIDMENLLDNYNVSGIEYIDGYKFRTTKGLFNNYINKWMNVKKNSEGFERAYAKLMLNSCFGKFVSRTDKVQMYCWFSKRHNRWKIRPNGYKQGGNSVYAPMGCYITSYARKRLLEAIKANKENFIYADTDSIYVRGEATGIEIDSNELGKWKVENKFKKINIIGKKQYCIEKLDGTVKLALAGVPEDLQEQIKTFDDFYVGKEFKYEIRRYDLDGKYLETETFTTKLKDEKII